MTTNNEHNIERLRSAVERYPWWNGGRMALLRLTADYGNMDETTRLVMSLHPTAAITLKEVDIARLTHLTTDDLIERFLKRDDYRIVAEDGVADDLSKHNIEDEEDMVSEELAEIYAKQGLYDDAIDTYRKLSLLNSEKSIYFAELIANLEEQRKK
jgi:tetratricopeptide (TPR) repeat protein